MCGFSWFVLGVLGFFLLFVFVVLCFVHGCHVKKYAAKVYVFFSSPKVGKAKVSRAMLVEKACAGIEAISGVHGEKN